MVLGLLGWCRSGGRSRNVPVQRRVVQLADEHSVAVKRWVDKVIMGLNLCPFARPAGEAGRIRIVTSSSSTPEGVLEDLALEASMLPRGTKPEELPHGQATTALVCCPFVQQWSDFDSFNMFYENALEEGYAFGEQELFVVAFHPAFGETSLQDLKDGDMIDLGTEDDGSPIRGRVLEAHAGFTDEGQQLAKVQVGDGEECFIRVPAVISEAERMVSKAPRPAFHLLRVSDLDRAEDAGLRERNRQTVTQIGPQQMEEMIKSCG